MVARADDSCPQRYFFLAGVIPRPMILTVNLCVEFGFYTYTLKLSSVTFT